VLPPFAQLYAGDEWGSFSKSLRSNLVMGQVALIDVAYEKGGFVPYGHFKTSPEVSIRFP
jgi:hypothetical protein